MSITGKPAATTVEQGDTVYFVYNNAATSGVVARTKHIVSDANNDNVAEQSDVFYLQGFPDAFRGSQLFLTKEALEAAIANQLDSL